MCCSGLICAHALSAPGWWRNKCSYSSIRHSRWTRVNGCPLFFFIAVVVMYWEARMRIHQHKHTLAEPCLFYVLFITNHIADALSDLSWTTVLACAEPCVENHMVRFFSANRSTPTCYYCEHVIYPAAAWIGIHKSCSRSRQVELGEMEGFRGVSNLFCCRISRHQSACAI